MKKKKDTIYFLFSSTHWTLILKVKEMLPLN